MEKHTYDADKDGRIEKDALEITLDKLLKGAGAGADPTEIAPFDILDKFREFIPWVSLDGFSVGGDTGYAITPQATRLTITTGNVADYDARIISPSVWHYLFDSGKAVTIEFPIVNMDSVASQNIWLRFATSTDDPPSETVNHFGWKIIGAVLYASNADGTTQTITDTGVSLSTSAQRTRLKIVFVPGTDCKYYVNDVLKVTHTTNLCGDSYAFLHFHMRTLEAAAKGISLGRVLIEKEYA